MLVTLLGIVMLVRLLQPRNAPFPMLVTLLGIVMLFRLLQPLNAQLSMLVTLFPIVMLVRLLQFWNAHLPMLVTLLGIVMLVRLLQHSNTPSPMLVTLLGITIFVIALLKKLEPLISFNCPLNVIVPTPVALSNLCDAISQSNVSLSTFTFAGAVYVSTLCGPSGAAVAIGTESNDATATTIKTTNSFIVFITSEILEKLYKFISLVGSRIKLRLPLMRFCKYKYTKSFLTLSADVRRAVMGGGNGDYNEQIGNSIRFASGSTWHISYTTNIIFQVAHHKVSQQSKPTPPQ